jgi:hypothetical protein
MLALLQAFLMSARADGEAPRIYIACTDIGEAPDQATYD